MDQKDLAQFLPLFLQAASENVIKLEHLLTKLSAGDNSVEVVDQAVFASHSLKGECFSIGFPATGETARLIEMIFRKQKEQGKSTLDVNELAMINDGVAGIKKSLESLKATQKEEVLQNEQQKLGTLLGKLRG